MQKPRFSWEKIALQLHTPFRIAHGVDEIRIAHWLHIADDHGWGEGTIPPYYHIPGDEMVAYWHQAAQSDEPFPDQLEKVPEWFPQDGPAPARCALEMALLDNIAHQQNIPLYELLGLAEPKSLPTSYTIAIDSPQRMAETAASLFDYQVIKVKLGGKEDEACIAAIRKARPDAKIRVDANTAWTLSEAVSMVKRLEQYDLEMIEQPLPKDDIEAMGKLQARTSIPIVADESVQTLDDIKALGQAGVRGVNLKLMKVGGLLTALEMIRLAQGYGMHIMLGCMIETSLGVTAMAHLTSLADWIDLDSPLLIKNDPFEGIEYGQHLTVAVPQGKGIGAKLRTV